MAIAVSAALGAGVAADAQEPTAEEQQQAVRDQAAALAAEIDVLEAEDAEIEAALAAVQTQVVGQQVVVNQKTDALQNAQAAVKESQAAIDALKVKQATLEAEVEAIIVDSYMNPPIDHALDAFDSDTLSQAVVKNGLVEIQSEADTNKIEQLAATKTELEGERDAKKVLAAEAATKKDEADKALADLEAAVAVQTQLAADIQTRLEAKRARAKELAETDAALSKQIAAEQAALAEALAAATAEPAQSGVSSMPGGLAEVPCPAGGSITVAESIASNLESLLNDAYADGITLCGGGYRDPEEQVELRRQHCGTSDYAVYEMPSSQCNPPTAKPGSSMHEQGLAIDFTCNGGGTVSSGDECFNWLDANAANYGLYNLPSEPWHWSTNGN